MNVSILIAAGGAQPTSSDGDPNSFLLVVGGALVGGLISLATTLVVEWWRGRGLKQAKEEDEAVRTKLASRLVQLELQEVEAVLKLALDQEPFHWPPNPNFEFRVAAWQNHAAHLAAQLPETEWKAIATPYSLLEYTNLSGEALTKVAAEGLLRGARGALSVASTRSGEVESA